MLGRRTLYLVASLFVLTLIAAVQSHAQTGSPVGIFESHGDVGTVLHPGDFS